MCARVFVVHFRAVIPPEMADHYELVCSAGHLFFFFFCSDGSCKSSFVWSLQEDHCSVAGCCCRKYGWWGGDCKEEEKGGIWERKMQMDYMCMSGKWAMRQEGRTWCSCASLFALWLRCSRWITEAPLTKKKQKNTLTPKGLDTQSSSLKQSNLFIWWFLICCFSASFHHVGLFSIPGSAERSMLRTHPAPAASWALVARDEKGHSESN